MNLIDTFVAAYAVTLCILMIAIPFSGESGAVKYLTLILGAAIAAVSFFVISI